MSDLIDRAEAISRAVELRMYGKPVKMVPVSELERLPSARAEERTNKRTETHACDLIDRQTAVDALRQYIVSNEPYDMEENTQGFNDGISCAILELSMQTSAQPSGKDPIEREAVVEILHDAMQGCSESEENLIGEIVCKVDLLPSAQPEIIRCRECKHSEHWYRDKARCFLWHEEGIDVFEDGYCSYAERREE